MYVSEITYLSSEIVIPVYKCKQLIKNGTFFGSKLHKLFLSKPTFGDRYKTSSATTA